MKFPVLWLSFVSLWVWAGTEKVICLAWDLVSRSHITLHFEFGAKAAKTKTKQKDTKHTSFSFAVQYLLIGQARSKQLLIAATLS